MTIKRPKAQLTSEQFYVNQTETIQDGWNAYLKSGEIAPLARLNPPWIVDALERDKSLHLAIYAGRFDPLNMREGDVIVTATLPKDVRNRVSNRCYESGHSIYKDEAARLLLAADMSRFVQENAER